jgi:hypothetical protein
MRRQLATELVLIAVLGYYGWTIHGANVRSEESQQARIAANQSFEVGKYTGFDTAGRRVFPFDQPGVDRVVTFLLRQRSLDNDLGIWLSIAPGARRRGVQLVGLCDGLACGSAVRARGAAIEFPVLLHSEVTSLQALLNADALGQGVVKVADRPEVAVDWRSPGQTPELLLARLLQ